MTLHSSGGDRLVKVEVVKVEGGKCSSEGWAESCQCKTQRTLPV